MHVYGQREKQKKIIGVVKRKKEWLYDKKKRRRKNHKHYCKNIDFYFNLYPPTAAVSAPAIVPLAGRLRLLFGEEAL